VIRRLIEKQFPRSRSALEEVHGWVEGFCQENSLTDKVAFAIDLAIEEIFVNFIEHNSEGTQEIAIALEVNGNALTATVSDFNVRRFDITAVKPPDVDRPLAVRTPGGLGIHFVRQVMDDVRYVYENGTSRVILMINLERT
jgi:serine/threonine-protein kinase RsbW